MTEKTDPQNSSLLSPPSRLSIANSEWLRQVTGNDETNVASLASDNRQVVTGHGVLFRVAIMRQQESIASDMMPQRPMDRMLVELFLGDEALASFVPPKAESTIYNRSLGGQLADLQSHAKFSDEELANKIRSLYLRLSVPKAAVDDWLHSLDIPRSKDINDALKRIYIGANPKIPLHLKTRKLREYDEALEETKISLAKPQTSSRFARFILERNVEMGISSTEDLASFVREEVFRQPTESFEQMNGDLLRLIKANIHVPSPGLLSLMVGVYQELNDVTSNSFSLLEEEKHNLGLAYKVRAKECNPTSIPVILPEILAADSARATRVRQVSSKKRLPTISDMRESLRNLVVDPDSGYRPSIQELRALTGKQLTIAEIGTYIDPAKPAVPLEKNRTAATRRELAVALKDLGHKTVYINRFKEQFDNISASLAAIAPPAALKLDRPKAEKQKNLRLG